MIDIAPVSSVTTENNAEENDDPLGPRGWIIARNVRSKDGRSSPRRQFFGYRFNLADLFIKPRDLITLNDSDAKALRRLGGGGRREREKNNEISQRESLILLARASGCWLSGRLPMLSD